ncbi:unnamed protein product [Polarella glacialis]|uniref:Uncharacterized protein n=1 Tax=Polarella glacialis TaxID=89957 RepID=A0A813I286_POLGL|nr:unnamed protein product [Polarella glacialis]
MLWIGAARACQLCVEKRLVGSPYNNNNNKNNYNNKNNNNHASEDRVVDSAPGPSDRRVGAVGESCAGALLFARLGDGGLRGSCSVLLLGPGSGASEPRCHVITVTAEDLRGAVSEAEVLACIHDLTQASEALPLLPAVAALAAGASAPIAFLDETAEEDWSWTAPELAETIVCLGVHEDFVEEISAVRAAAGASACRDALLGPVALHSSACLHLLASVRPGRPRAPLAPVRPVIVQFGSAPRAASARSFRRTLPRRQPIRFVLALPGPPLETAASRAEVHQAIVASCLVSKSVYDERDTQLTIAWPAACGMRAVTVDRTLLSRSETKVLPAEQPVLQAFQEQLAECEESLETVLAAIVTECSRLSFGHPVCTRVVEGDSACWPTWDVQESWPTDPPIVLFLHWPGALPFPEAASVVVPGGSVGRLVVVLQHWHTLGILAANLTPRVELPSRGVLELLADVAPLVPRSREDVQIDTLVPFHGTVLGRLRNGHVLFPDFGSAKAMCKDQRLGLHFDVLVQELHVGDVFYCTGYPGLDYNGDPVLFVKDVLAIEPGRPDKQKLDPEVLYHDTDLLVMLKPSGMNAQEDKRHLKERGTAMRVAAEHLVSAPEIEVSGPAVYSWHPCPEPQRQRRSYLLLVAGSPSATVCCAALRPKQGQPHESAETQLEVLWRGADCSLLRATVNGCERKAQVRRHMHILGFPVWGDRRFGNQRANVRCREVYGLAKPWCHLARFELWGRPFGSFFCESPPPQDLSRVLMAVGCTLEFPSSCRREVTPSSPPELLHLEHGLSIRGYIQLHGQNKSQKQSAEFVIDGPGTVVFSDGFQLRILRLLFSYRKRLRDFQWQPS